MATNAPKLGSTEERDCGWLFTLPPLAGASFPRKAYSRVLELFQTASEHLVLETKPAPAARATARKHRVLARGTRSSGRPATSVVAHPGPTKPPLHLAGFHGSAGFYIAERGQGAPNPPPFPPPPPPLTPTFHRSPLQPFPF